MPYFLFLSFFSFKAWISLLHSQCAQATHIEVVLEMNLLVHDLPLRASAEEAGVPLCQRSHTSSFCAVSRHCPL